MKFRLLPTLLFFAFCIMSAACDSASKNSEKTVAGHVIDVQALTIDAFSSLTIRDAEGKEWVFEGGVFTGFTPSHLIAHRAEGQPVIVTYRESDDGVLRALKLEDG